MPSIANRARAAARSVTRSARRGTAATGSFFGRLFAGVRRFFTTRRARRKSGLASKSATREIEMMPVAPPRPRTPSPPRPNTPGTKPTGILKNYHSRRKVNISGKTKATSAPPPTTTRKVATKPPAAAAPPAPKPTRRNELIHGYTLAELRRMRNTNRNNFEDLQEHLRPHEFNILRNAGIL